MRQTGPVAGSKHDQIRAGRAALYGEGPSAACLLLLVSACFTSPRFIVDCRAHGAKRADLPPRLHGIQYGRRSFSGLVCCKVSPPTVCEEVVRALPLNPGRGSCGEGCQRDRARGGRWK